MEYFLYLQEGGEPSLIYHLEISHNRRASAKFSSDSLEELVHKVKEEGHVFGEGDFIATLPTPRLLKDKENIQAPMNILKYFRRLMIE